MGLGGYLKTLVATVVFPILWVRSWNLAVRHEHDDSQARVKVVAAFMVGTLLAGAGAMAVLSFEENATSGMYERLDLLLKKRIRAQEFEDNDGVITAKNDQVPTVTKNLGDRRAFVEGRMADLVDVDGFKPHWDALRVQADALVAAGRENGRAFGKAPDMVVYTAAADRVALLWAAGVANVTDEERALEDTTLMAEAIALAPTLATAEYERAFATVRKSQLEAHNALYIDLVPVIKARQDASVRAAIATFAGRVSDDKELAIDMDAVDYAFSIKNDAVSDMAIILNWFVWWCVAGLFYGPLAFALGSILKKSWKASESVGFKPYPGASMGLFLLGGGLGVPSVPLAAWAFHDMELRSTEGQIAL